MKEKIKEKKNIIIIILIMFLILILFFTGYSMGKSFSKINIDGNTQIAKPIFDVQNSGNFEIDNINSHGTYEFVVRNFNLNGEKSDVDIEYYIELLNVIQNDAIKIRYLKNEEEIKINGNRTENFYLNKNEKQEDKFKIEITYEKDKNIKMEDILETLEIKVHSEQKQEVL